MALSAGSVAWPEAEKSQERAPGAANLNSFAKASTAGGEATIWPLGLIAMGKNFRNARDF
jgi:hypothetical protein